MKRVLALLLIMLFTQGCLASEVNDTKDAAVPAEPVSISDIEQDASVEQAVERQETKEDIDAIFEEYAQSVATAPIQGYVQYEGDDEGSEPDAVYFDGSASSKKLNLSKPKIINARSVKAEVKKPTFEPFDKNLIQASKFSTHEYSINPVNAKYSFKMGNISFGTAYDSSLDSSQMSYTTSFFARYDTKYFAFSSGLNKNTSDSSESFKDKFYFAPEIKITKRLSFLDVMQSDVSQINKKNEFVIRYTPGLGKNRDDVQLELGAGQSFYNDEYVKSSVRFSTRFQL